MKTYRIEDMKKGWFVGNFKPAALSSNDVEVAYHSLEKDHTSDGHYHMQAIELNLITSGLVEIENVSYGVGDIFVFEPGERTNIRCMTDVDLIVVKSPSVEGDKYY